MPIRRVFKLDCSHGFVLAKQEIYFAAEEIMEYVDKEYREFCAANGIPVEKKKRATA